MICRICGQDGEGQLFEQWVKPTFTDWDKLKPGNIICTDCLFWFDERSEELARRVGKEKPQRMRNYSHFVVNGEWIPLSKGDKRRMQKLLLGAPFPELAAIAQSGQKHIIFRAPYNPVGSETGWVQFEEQSMFVIPAALRAMLDMIEALYVTFSKAEIETGQYKQYRIRAFGLEEWAALEREVTEWRGKPLFDLALFLAQKPEDNDDADARGSRDTARGHLEGDTGRLQEPVQAVDLAAVRGSRAQRGLHEQPGPVRQLTLFEPGGAGGDERRGPGNGGPYSQQRP